MPFSGYKKAYVTTDNKYYNLGESDDSVEFYVAVFPQSTGNDYTEMWDWSDQNGAYESVNKYNAAWGDEDAAEKLR
jgi:hypothetical protein